MSERIRDIEVTLDLTDGYEDPGITDPLVFECEGKLLARQLKIDHHVSLKCRLLPAGERQNRPGGPPSATRVGQESSPEGCIRVSMRSPGRPRWGTRGICSAYFDCRVHVCTGEFPARKD
jgi:hypothetical protein